MDASSSAFCSVLATTLRIYHLEVDLVNVPVPVWVQYITGTGIPFNASTHTRILSLTCHIISEVYLSLTLGAL